MVVESEYKAVTLIMILLLSLSNVTASTITITSLPSASNTGLTYQWTVNSWINYCPNCGAYNTLVINPKGVPEQEITCSKSLGGCDSDYCGSSGKEKGYTKRCLIRAKQIPIIRKIILTSHHRG